MLRNERKKDSQTKKIRKPIEEIRKMMKQMSEGQKEKETIQLVKLRSVPWWSGQDFDKIRIEVQQWFDNNKGSDEDKYINLEESLKKITL